MPEFVTLSCPSCGAKLQVGSDLERFACAHCGNEHVVNRGGGVVSLAPVLEQLQNVHSGVNKTASELAIKRLKEEINDLKDKKAAIKNAGCLAMMLPTGLITSAVLGVIVAVVLQAYDEGMGIVVGLVIFTFIAAGIIDLVTARDAAHSREEIDKQIAAKYSELKHHQEIVSSI